MKILESIFGNSSTKALNSYAPLLKKVVSFEEEYTKLLDSDFPTKTNELKERVKKGESLDSLLPEAFALTREASKRCLGMRHFDEQLLGGAALHFGKITEMRTGEGKTLVATLPLYLNALAEKGVHLVTVNDYLSRRDAVWMGELFAFLGLSTGVLNSDSAYIYDPNHKELDTEKDEVASYKVVHEFLRPVTKKEAYAADITYGTNSEFGFDYLRDNISYRKDQVVQREFFFAIVDEVDSILIDEARTPLIISAPANKSEKLYETFAKIAGTFEKETDFTVDEKFRSIALTEAGIEKAEKALNIQNLYAEGGVKFVHHLETAVKAKALFNRDKEYVVKDGEIVIVDEFTGRMQPGRRWSEGLHQAIEAKEGVNIKEESRTYASVTYQNYFRMYGKLSGMTGTAETSKEEFFKVYGLDTVIVPTHRPVQRIDENDLVFKTEKGKFMAVARKVKELHSKGQPVLIGTVSIEKNELLSAYLKREGVPHQILNAKNHEKEGEIIADAGKRGAVTIATNMAGRGVDIKLGGVPFSEEKAEEVRALGGLFVLGTERHEARRIDNQLRGRSGRQGDPGETQFFVSFDDDLLRVFAGEMMKKMLEKLETPEDEPITGMKLVSRSIENAQTRIEGFHFDSRKHVLEYDNVLNIQRKAVYEKRRRALFSTGEEMIQFMKEIVAGDEELEKILQKKIEQFGEGVFGDSLRGMYLQTIDLFWMDHLEMMDYLRGSVNLRAYGQRDPLVEYKKEGLRLYKDMEAGIEDTIFKAIPEIGGQIKEEALDDGKETFAEVEGEEKQSTSSPVTAENVPGRNDPCYCGSGKKYKKCHGK